MQYQTDKHPNSASPTYSFGFLVGGIGNGCSKIQVYSGLIHRPVGFGEITRFGRSARGEKFCFGNWRSHTEVWQQGQPLWIDRQWLPLVINTMLSPALSFCDGQATQASVPGYLLQQYRCHLSCGLEKHWIEGMIRNLHDAERMIRESAYFAQILPPESPGEPLVMSLCRLTAHRVRATVIPYAARIRELLGEISRERTGYSVQHSSWSNVRVPDVNQQLITS